MYPGCPKGIAGHARCLSTIFPAGKALAIGRAFLHSARRAHRTDHGHPPQPFLHLPALPRMRTHLSQAGHPHLRVRFRTAGGRLRLRRHRGGVEPRDHRRPAADHVALPRAAAHRRRADGRHTGGFHAAGARGPSRPPARAARVVHQERHGQLPHPVVQGPGGFRGSEPRPGTRLRGGRLRLDGQPGQLRRGQRRGGRADQLRADPRRPGKRQGAQFPGVRHAGHRHPRRLRPGQPPVLGDRGQVRLGFREREHCGPITPKAPRRWGSRSRSRWAGARPGIPWCRWPAAPC